ncbi:hypothetical protein WR25_21507 [Diploscapter pachys]|uniref:Uncharacterized protein n=1 Tax=Diploscapter pachys TaxID=2018661 RepID=A0A2A2M574_9BILA|nr:hypothetical protein WR25_21507 [Diploscapter pachys]
MTRSNVNGTGFAGDLDLSFLNPDRRENSPAIELQHLSFAQLGASGDTDHHEDDVQGPPQYFGPAHPVEQHACRQSVSDEVQFWHVGVLLGWPAARRRAVASNDANGWGECLFSLV